MSMNKVIMIGRLTREPELRFTASGKPVANFTLAVDRNRPNAQGEKETDFIRIIVWGKQAENCSNYLGKGRLVGIEGRLQISKYQDREGKDRTSAEIVAEFVQFLDRAPNNNGGSSGSDRQPGNNDFGQGAGDLGGGDFGSGGWNDDEPPF